MIKNIVLPVLLLLACITARSQKVYYYDSSWVKTTPDKAFLKVEVTSANDLVNYKRFYMSTGKLYSETYYKDTTYRNPVGISKSFYKDGQLLDSSFYNDRSERVYSYHYFENGKLRAEAHYDPAAKKEIAKGFDSTGREIGGFILEQEAEFNGGNEGWRNHIIKNLNPNVPVKKKAPEGTYKVIVRFIVSTDGSLSDISTETNFGYGMEEEATRVIKKSPKWKPAIQYDKPVKAYRRQPITFVVM